MEATSWSSLGSTILSCQLPRLVPIRQWTIIIHMLSYELLRMPLGARLAVNTHNMGGRFVESMKNAQWSMNPQEAGDGLESIIEFQVQIKGHNQQEYEDTWQG